MVWDVVTKLSVRAAAAAIAVVVPTLVAFGSAPNEPAKKVVSPRKSEVATTWVGLSEDGHYLLRLILREDGSGDGAYVFLDGEPAAFHLRWDYEGGRIVLKINRSDVAPSLPGGLMGEVGDVMSVVAQGPDWRLRFCLRKEELLETRWRRLVTAMSLPSTCQKVPTE